MSTISGLSLYPVVWSNLTKFAAYELLMYVRMYKRSDTEYVYFRAGIGSVYTNYDVHYVGGYGLNTYVNMVSRLRFSEAPPCTEIQAQSYVYGAPPQSLSVGDGDLVLVSCRGSPSDTCLVETDGGSSLAIPIVDADGDGVGVGAALISISGSGTVTVKGTASEALIMDLGKYPIPTSYLDVYVAELPQHQMWLKVYSHVIGCVRAMKPLEVDVYTYGAYRLLG